MQGAQTELEKFARIGIPVLLVQAKDDPVHPESTARALSEALPAATTTVVVVAHKADRGLFRYQGRPIARHLMDALVFCQGGPLFTAC